MTAFTSAAMGRGRHLRKQWHALLALCPLLQPVTQAVAEDGLTWSVTPYLWATETRYDLTFDGTPVDSGTVTFDHLVDTTDASFQLVTELGWSGGRWSAFADATYLDTSNTYNGPLLRIDSDSEQWLVDGGVAWWPWGEAGGFNLFLGARYADLDDQYDFKLVDSGTPLGVADNQRDFLDAMLGLRQRFDLSDRWSLLTRADYSGGDSEGIWQVQAVFRYGLGEEDKYGLMLGYRSKEAKYEYGSVEEDNEYYGPWWALT